MGLRIGTNLASMSAQRALSKTNFELSKTYQRLASGNRIINSGDDAAGLSISDNLKAQVRSWRQAERNTNDGISFVQVAEGGLYEISNILVRMRELSIQASSDTIGDREREFINSEVQALTSEVDRIANSTNFNGTPLLNGEAPNSPLTIQVGIRNQNADRIEFDTNENNVTAGQIGVDGVSATNADDARSMIDTVDEAMNRVSASRARLGAMQNKLHSTVNNIGIVKENLEQARSRVADVDVAEATSDLVKDTILSQAGLAVLAQANNSPRETLRLFL